MQAIRLHQARNHTLLDFLHLSRNRYVCFRSRASKVGMMHWTWWLSSDLPLFHFLKWRRPTSILGRRPEHWSFIRASPPVLTQNGWYCFVTNKTVKFYSESKQIYWSMATANTSNIELVHRHFSSEKYVDPLNAANMFNVHAFLHGIWK